jgi:hypothetical protein
MSNKRALLCALLFVAGFIFAGAASRVLANPAGDSKAQADQEVLKMNA